MKFHKDRLKECNKPIRNITYTSRVEEDASYSIQTLMQMASEGKPLPALKQYQFMDAKTIDLTVPTDNVDDMCSAMDVAKKSQAYKELEDQWTKEREEEKASQAREQQKQAIIDEYKASLNTSNN